ncbi:MAG: PH domain-containing protein [Novosphingobium sp.]
MSETEAAPAFPQRLHPAGLLVGFVTRLPQLFVQLAAALYGTRSTNIAAPWVIAAVLAFSLLFRWLAWLRFHYTLGPDDIRIERGLVSRTARAIPYDRIQDVSIEQRPLARAFGIAEVKFETGGGKGDEAALAFVSRDEAERLRETVRARRGDGAAVAGAASEAPEIPVFAMDGRRLVTLGFYSFSLVIFAVLGGAAQQLDFLLPFDLWDFGEWAVLAEGRGVDLAHLSRTGQIGGALAALVALAAVGSFTGIVRTVLTDYGFRLDRTAKGFRRRRGLLTRTDLVMPVARVQAALVGTGPVRKRRGWHALRFVSLAQDGKNESHHVVAPLATLEEIWPIAAEARIAPPAAELAFERARPGPWIDLWLIAAALAGMAVTGIALATGVTAWWSLIVLAGFALVLRWSWRHHCAAADAAQLYARHGWWNQQLGIARQVNVQSVSIRQGPLLRRRGLADVHFGIAGGSLEFRALPLAAAQAIRAQVLRVAAPVDFSDLDMAS